MLKQQQMAAAMTQLANDITHFFHTESMSFVLKINK